MAPAVATRCDLAIAERASNADVVVPPRATTKLSDQADQRPRWRNRHLQTIAACGRIGWQRVTGSGRHALAEPQRGQRS